MRVARADLPWLARTASDAARNAQDRYLRLVSVDLCLLIAAAFVSAIDSPDPTVKLATAVATATLMALGLVLMGVTQQERQGRGWVHGRAAAESAKTHAWQYMTRAEPYEGDAESDAVDRRFERNLTEMLYERADFARMIGARDEATDMLTPTMRHVRALDTAARTKIYVRDRLAAQQEYYLTRVVANQKQQRTWFLVVISAQALGLIGAVAKIVWVDLPITLAGVFATVAAAALAWLQLKQYQELAQSYGLAAQELALVRTRASRVKDETDLSAFVTNAEKVISREHGQWIARREQ